MINKEELANNILVYINATEEIKESLKDILPIATGTLINTNYHSITPLNELQTMVLRERFGINNELAPKTLDLLAKTHNLSKSRIAQVEVKAIRRLLQRMIIAKEAIKLCELNLDDSIKEYIFANNKYYSINDLLKPNNEIPVEIFQKIVNSTNSYLENNEIPLEQLNNSILQLNLSQRVYNSLRRANINTLEDLISKTELDLFRVRNLGPDGRQEIITALNSLGLSLISDDEKYEQEEDLTSADKKL